MNSCLAPVAGVTQSGGAIVDNTDGDNRSLDSERAAKPTPAAGPLPQKFKNGEVHDWYRIVLGYSDHLVSGILDRFELGAEQWVLDPFCGTGTTLIECKKRGINSVGLDVNPSSLFAARVKTDWSIRPDHLRNLVPAVEMAYLMFLRRRTKYKADPTYVYLEETGMLDRGWISPSPLKKSLAIKAAVKSLVCDVRYKDCLMLALMSEVVTNAANVKFGPELYCGPRKEDVDVWAGYVRRLEAMASDLKIVQDLPQVASRIIEADARECGKVVSTSTPNRYAAVICSPPYPTEHDYTRNSRLELAFLEMVSDRETLRQIKRGMIRSHTKGIYKGDDDSSMLTPLREIAEITAAIDVKAAEKTHGFARLYSTVVREYFGGMQRHFQSILPLLQPGALCAYVVGDQSSYLQIHINTADILARLAKQVGFELVEVAHWRSRWSTITSRPIGENILILRKPDRE